MGIRDLFIALLAREGGERAVRYFLGDRSYPSQSQEEAAHNRAVKEVISSEAFRALSPLEQLVALAGWLQPATQKLPHNARRLCPGYAEAEEAWSKAMDGALRALPPGVIRLLREDLRVRAYRLWALEREPKAEIQTEAGEYVVRLCRDSRDAWWAQLFYKGGSTLAVSPTYLRAGHLSSRRISLMAKYWVDASGRPVVTVVVDHSMGCGRPNCPLPATTEFYYNQGWRGSPWRVNVMLKEALLTSVGERRVRQGDMVFALDPCRQVGEMVSEYCPVPNPDALPDAPPPDWTSSHCPEGVERWVKAWWGEVVGVVTRGEVWISHPEYPTARVWLNIDRPLILFARPVSGKIQYEQRLL
jgi:hypothetical protein